MKIILIFFTLFLSIFSFAQVDRASVSFMFSAGTEMNPNVNEGTLVLSFQSGLSRTEFTTGALGTTTKIVDQNSGKSLMLFGVKERLFAVQLEVGDKAEVAAKVVVMNETKVICGYTCKKAIVEKEGKTYTIWFTDQLTTNLEGQDAFMGLGIAGFPLEITANNNGIVVSLVAKEVSLTVPPNAFSLAVPDGYELIEKEQIGEKMIEASGH